MLLPSRRLGVLPHRMQKKGVGSNFGVGTRGYEEVIPMYTCASPGLEVDRITSSFREEGVGVMMVWGRGRYNLSIRNVVVVFFRRRGCVSCSSLDCCWPRFSLCGERLLEGSAQPNDQDLVISSSSQRIFSSQVVEMMRPPPPSWVVADLLSSQHSTLLPSLLFKENFRSLSSCFHQFSHAIECLVHYSLIALSVITTETFRVHRLRPSLYSSSEISM